MTAFIGNVLSKLREEVQRLEELEVARDTAEQARTCDLRELLALRLLAPVHDLTRLGDPNQPGEAEGTAGHVLHQTLDSGAVSGLESDTAIHAEAAVSPSTYLLDQLRLDLTSVYQQLEYTPLP